jgi:chemotaxis response regulator CheB
MADQTAGAAGSDMATALAALQAEVAGLRQGLTLMLETQATHIEMLRHLMEAAAAPGESETALSDAMAKIASILTRQTGGLEAIQAVLLRLPQDVGQTVAEGVREALSRG